ncbi:hypothetical protein B0I35DRAFT_173183 [Stachybotrys elegans]|uniref:Zn(2)-C6 fungal-type domain-containing protein n=1 Tax=Stachybotrys elegans TaxID=80388 RepID=A0A8K0SXY7_9HYPO|nr:hypothetical protein B0I35DRAFT_173183 [Stachybotrys elegans]
MTSSKALTAVSSATIPKSRRVRTGCLTCRKRHLKCDEGTPDCMNCRKSGRVCERGIRLNFLSAHIGHIPNRFADESWAVEFKDESRDIAAEYEGGLRSYGPNVQKHVAKKPRQLALIKHPASPVTGLAAGRTSPWRPCEPPANQHTGAGGQGEVPGNFEHSNLHIEADFSPVPESYGIQVSPYNAWDGTPDIVPRAGDVQSIPSSSPDLSGFSLSPREIDMDNTCDCSLTQPFSPSLSYSGLASNPRVHSATVGEVLYLKVYVDEVGRCMDLMTQDKLFTYMIPNYALNSTVLLNALLACGARQLSFKAPELKEKAGHYYNTAVRTLFRKGGAAGQDLSERAIASVILYAYEVMWTRSLDYVNDANAPGELLRKCGWNSRSRGTAGACFWLNNWVQVLKCLAFRSQVGGSGPCDWLDGEELGAGETVYGQEDGWVRRMLSILAAVANFRASVHAASGGLKSRDMSAVGERLVEWQGLKRLCDDWHETCPKSMHPLVHLHASQAGLPTCFPSPWFPSSGAILGRLFYHTAQCILAQTYPHEPVHGEHEMRGLQKHHAHEICGIVARAQGGEIAVVAARSLAIAAAVLTERAERLEVLRILDQMNAGSSWGPALSQIKEDLEKEWGWS